MIQYLLAAGLGALIGDANKKGGNKKSYAKGGRLARVGDTVSFNEGVTAYSPISGRVIDVVGSVLTVKDAIGKEHKVRSGDIFEIIEKVTDYDWERPKMAQGGMTITQAVRDVEKAKKKLIGQAKRKGLSENFGQKEVRDLSDKYGREMFSFSIEGQEIRRLIDDFDSWTMDFDLSDLARFDNGGQTMSEFIAFYGGEKKILEATSLLDARDKAREAFRVPKSKRGLLSVMSKQSYDNQDFRMFDKGGQTRRFQYGHVRGTSVDLDSEILFEDIDGLIDDNDLSVEWSVFRTGDNEFTWIVDGDIYKNDKFYTTAEVGEESTLERAAKSLYKFLQFADIRGEDGARYAKGGKTKREEYVANLPQHERWELVRDITDQSIEKMDLDGQLGALFEYGHHDLERKFVGRDKALQKAHDDNATFDLPTMNFSTSEFAKGGIATAEIDDFGKNVLGTASFDLKVKGTMRKPQNFTVYPMSGDTDKIYIQSKNRMGAIDPKTGRGAISKAHNFAGFTHLQHDISVGDATFFLLSGSQLTKLKDAIRGTFQKEAYSNKGAIGIDNRGSRSFAKGGKTTVLDADEVLQHFVMAMLFAGSDEEGIPLDDNYDFDNVNESDLMKAREGIEKFLHENAEIIEKHNLSAGFVGHDLWMSPTGQGVGFMFRHNEHPTLTEEEGEALDKSAQKIMGNDMYAIAYGGEVEIDGLPFQYAKGGKTKKKRKKVSDFDKLAMKVAARYRGQPVEKKYQKEYGKRYDNEEAMEVGRKVAAKVARQQMAKKRR